MKSANLLLAACLSGVLLAGPAFAVNSRSSTLPKPIKVVHPVDLPPSFKNAEVMLSFVLDQNGVPHDVTAVKYLPDSVANKLLPVVAQWRFTPMLKDGHPVQARVILPLKLIEGSFGFASSAPNPGSVTRVAAVH